MPPVNTINNQYLGVNAHLHSYLQHQGEWNGFHTIHISHLAITLQAQLRLMGYEARAEQSLQIRRAGQVIGYPRSDVTIYDPITDRPPQTASSAPTNVGEVVMSIPTLLNLREDDIEYYRAIGIYEIKTNRAEQRQPVVWIELLSPANKPTGSHFPDYKQKRAEILQSGVVFVEIDYLHHYPPAFESLPNYRLLEPDSHPYRITILDPRPDFFAGQGRSRQFNVDDPIPTMTIPLNAGDALPFDFGTPYHKTFVEMFYGDKVDYAQLPDAFDFYNPDDQTRIVQRMLAVLKAAQTGTDLETGPFLVESLALEDGLAQLEAWK
jgi:hypothetical protein